MAQSSEYPDLSWIPPRAFGAGRDGKAVRYIVVHYTAGSERSTSAEDGAHNDQNRTDGTSTHYFVDSDSVVQCVLTRDRGNAARTKGNRLGIQYELCGTAQTRTQWLDPASNATLTNAARQMARDCQKYGIPVRRLSVSQTRADWFDFPAGLKGIVGHVDCTNAYPEDGGDHTDPGTAFPWDILLDRIQQFMTGDDDVSVTDVRDGIYQMTDETAHRSSAPGRQTSDNLKIILTDMINPLLAPLTAALTAAFNDADKAEILAAVSAARVDISNVDEAIAAKWGDPAVPDAAVADALRDLLGPDRAVRIATLLAA